MKALLSVYYKLKILPGLVWSRHEVGVVWRGLHICVSVALNFNSWRLERPGGGWGLHVAVGGTTGGREGVCSQRLYCTYV